MRTKTQTIQFIQITPEQLQNAIIEGVKHQLNEFKKHFKPIEPNEYLSRLEVSKMLSVDLSTIHNWTKQGKLTSYQIGGRVFYKRAEVENAIVKIK